MELKTTGAAWDLVSCPTLPPFPTVSHLIDEEEVYLLMAEPLTSPKNPRPSNRPDQHPDALGRDLGLGLA